MNEYGLDRMELEQKSHMLKRRQTEEQLALLQSVIDYYQSDKAVFKKTEPEFEYETTDEYIKLLKDSAVLDKRHELENKKLDIEYSDVYLRHYEKQIEDKKNEGSENNITG